jgi:DNA-binding NarL/FixJ family response regulator
MYKFLTNREYDIVSKLHKNNDEIATDLNISVNTVTTMIQRLFKKRSARNRVEIVIKSLKMGLLDLDSFD